ncbi:MurR/RpiR family transcriptional regulator [Pelagibius sp.]|uniref:MurR/RpiR family transcriptional regulator n=1 Tax=Pelagibius sp. TaxID=1931238 RepID=UPI003BB119A3
MTETEQSMKVAVDNAMPTLTRNEKQAARILLAHYPMIGLESITSFAKAAKVSSATIQRFVQKLGCDGYPEFRQKLRDEIAKSDENPLTLHRSEDHVPAANTFRKSLIAALDGTLGAVKPNELAKIIELLSENKQKIFILGGTFTGPLAMHLHFHLRKMRPGVTLLEADMPRRNDSMLDIRRNDVLIVFDIRRYQPDSVLTARWAAERIATVILFTDKWMSEIATFAKHALRCKVQASTPWDTLVGMTALVELIASSLDSVTWPSLKTRLEALDKLRSETFVPDWHQ